MGYVLPVFDFLRAALAPRPWHTPRFHAARLLLYLLCAVYFGSGTTAFTLAGSLACFDALALCRYRARQRFAPAPHTDGTPASRTEASRLKRCAVALGAAFFVALITVAAKPGANVPLVVLLNGAGFCVMAWYREAVPLLLSYRAAPEETV